MHRLNCWICTLIAVFFCFAFLLHPTFAMDETLGGPKTKIEALELRNAQLKAELVHANARIAELKAAIAKAEKQVATAQKAEIAMLNAHIDAINSEIVKLVVHYAAVEQLAVQTSVSDESQVSESPEQLEQAFGEFQKAEYLSALYEMIESLVAERTFLEAGVAQSRVQMVAGGLLKDPHTKIQASSDVKTPVVTANEKELAKEVAALKQEVVRLQAVSLGVRDALSEWKVLSVILIVTCVALLVLYGAKKRQLYERNDELARLARVPPTLGEKPSDGLPRGETIDLTGPIAPADKTEPHL